MHLAHATRVHPDSSLPLQRSIKADKWPETLKRLLSFTETVFLRVREQSGANSLIRFLSPSVDQQVVCYMAGLASASMQMRMRQPHAKAFYF